MLKLILLCGILGFQLPAHAQIHGCLSSDQCKTDHCCLRVDDFSGKRLIYGTCSPRNQPGAHCYVNNDNFLETDAQNIYSHFCPCQGNATCFSPNTGGGAWSEVGTCTV